MKKKEQWRDLDIADQIAMPPGMVVEKRTTEGGKLQFRNPTIIPKCNLSYLRLLSIQ